jgi:colicin import membrane protein
MTEQGSPKSEDTIAENATLHKENRFKNVVSSPAFISVALHAFLLISLLVSFTFSAKPLQFVNNELSAPAQQADIVKATFIDSNVIEQKKREKAQSEAAAKKRQQDIRRKEEQKREALRKKRAEDARKKREEAEKEQQQQDLLKQQQDKERAIAAQREKEAKEKAAQEKRQQALDKELAKQLEEEQAAMSQANQKRVMTEVEKYKALIYSKVKQNLQTDGGFIGETCVVDVRLAPDGLVLQAEAVDGKPALCQIAEAAIFRARTLPVSKDPGVMAQFRNFEIEVSPEK